MSRVGGLKSRSTATGDRDPDPSHSGSVLPPYYSFGSVKDTGLNYLLPHCRDTYAARVDRGGEVEDRCN